MRAKKTKTTLFTISCQLAKIQQMFSSAEFLVEVHIGVRLLQELAKELQQPELKLSWLSNGDVRPFRFGGGPRFLPDHSLGTNYEIRLRGQKTTPLPKIELEIP